jgi:tetratricopeptide (TPR) repeat protein
MTTRASFFRFLAFFVALSLLSIPMQVSAQSKKGVKLYGAGQFEEAEAAFREAQKSNPSDTPNNYYLGLSILLQDRFGEALDVLVKVKQSLDRADQRTRPAVPDEFQINLAMARARLGLHQYEEAWKNLESARNKNASSSDVYVYRGVYYFQQDKFTEAIKELEKAISLDAKNPYAYYYEGLVYYKAGQADKAVNSLKMFLQLYPNAPEAVKAKEIVDKLC